MARSTCAWREAARRRPTSSTNWLSRSWPGCCSSTATSHRRGRSPAPSSQPASAAPITTTGALAALVARAKGGRQGPRDPATRTFQALRIVVNDEIGELERGLAAAEAAAAAGRSAGRGRRSIPARTPRSSASSTSTAAGRRSRRAICRRSAMPAARWRWVRQGVIKPSAAEIAANPRARSARLRAAERLPAPGQSGVLQGEEEGSPWRRAA